MLVGFSVTYLFPASISASKGLLSSTEDKHDLKQNLKDIILSKKDAVSFLSKRHITEQNIVCECCRYRCSLFELMGYCSDGFGFFFKKRGDLPALPPAVGTPFLNKLSKAKSKLQSKLPHGRPNE